MSNRRFALVCCVAVILVLNGAIIYSKTRPQEPDIEFNLSQATIAFADNAKPVVIEDHHAHIPVWRRGGWHLKDKPVDDPSTLLRFDEHNFESEPCSIAYFIDRNTSIRETISSFNEAVKMGAGAVFVIYPGETKEFPSLEPVPANPTACRE